MTSAGVPAAREKFQARIVALLPRLRRFCHGLAGNRDLGDDLLQITVERALARHDQWEPGTSLENWTMKIASNANIDRLRAEKVRGFAVGIDEAHDLPGEDALALLEFRSELEAARAALAAMPEPLRAVMAAVVIDGQSYREAAELFEIPIGTVMSRVSRARQFVEAFVRRGPERMVAA
ncbi:RNA polymerase sigma factor [Novosphingobium bradum]|uniref:RNA polymerase sigma factor n=1 Tax=Novosphingobium bradum TaxID=1737444 RepID=A0ABV7IS46_9SPHN